MRGKRILTGFIGILILVSVILAGYFAYTKMLEKQRKDASLKALSTEEYQGVFISMYDISSFSGEDFKTYKGVPTYKEDYSFKTAAQINEAIKAVFSSGNTITNVCIGLEPLMLWHSEKDDIIGVQERFENGWFTYADAHPEVRFEVLFSFPSMEYWLSLKEEEVQNALVLYRQLTDILSARGNIVTYYVGGQEWLINNPANYNDDFAANEIVSQKLFLLTFCDGELEITSANSEIMMRQLSEQIEKNRKHPVEYPNLSEWDIVFLGDSIIGNYEGSFSIPGVVNGLSGASVYNCGRGGSSAAQPEQEGWGFPRMAEIFVEGAVSETETNFGKGVAEYYSAEHSGKKTCFVINYGINDYYVGNSIDNEEKPYDITTFGGALRQGIATLQEKYPDAVYMIMGPGKVTLFENGTEVLSDMGGRLSDYYDKARDISEELGVCYIDIYEEFPNEKDELSDVLADGTHYNEYGRYMVGIKVINDLSVIIS